MEDWLGVDFEEQEQEFYEVREKRRKYFCIMGIGIMLSTFSGAFQCYHKHETLSRGSDVTSGYPGGLHVFHTGESRQIQKLRLGKGSREEINESERQTFQLSYMSNNKCNAVWENTVFFFSPM